MAKQDQHCEAFSIDLPNGLKGTVQLRVDLPALARELGWKAYYNSSRRATLKNGIVEARIIAPGVAAENRAAL
jgi:hypothetical protein